MFSCFNFSITVTHMALKQSLNLRQNLRLLSDQTSVVALLAVLHLFGHVLKTTRK